MYLFMKFFLCLLDQRICMKFDMYFSYFEGGMSCVLIRRILISKIWDHVAPIFVNVDPVHFSCNSNYASIFPDSTPTIRDDFSLPMELVLQGLMMYVYVWLLLTKLFNSFILSPLCCLLVDH